MSTPTISTSDELLDDLFRSLELKAQRLHLSEEEAALALGSVCATRTDWEVLKSSLAEEEKQRCQQNVRFRFQESLRRKLISDWVERNAGVNQEEQEWLKGEIDSYVKEGRTEDLRAYLSDILRVGLKKARSRRKRKQWGDGGYFGHAWEALTGLARVVIVVGVFGAARTKFETIVFAMLVMIYYAIYGASSGYLQIIQGVGFGIDNQFKRLRRLLKEEITGDDRETEYEAEQDLRKEAGRGKVRFWIRSAFFAVIWLIAIWELVKAVFS